MKPQMIYTRAKTLGPFLTLILLSSSRRRRASSEALRSASAEVPTSDYVPFAKREETFCDAKPTPRPPLKLGPILTLILTVAQHRSEGLLELAVRV
jgi:hypothetical protein